MTLEAGQSSTKEKPDQRTDDLVKEARELSEQPINFENLYKGDALIAISNYGGLLKIIEAFGRLRRYVDKIGELERSGEMERLTEENIKMAEEALNILKMARAGEDLSSLDKAAALFITQDLVRHGAALKKADALDETTKHTFNKMIKSVWQILGREEMPDNAQFLNMEPTFPLAWTFQRVEAIEHMLLERQNTNNESGRRPVVQKQDQKHR